MLLHPSLAFIFLLLSSIPFMHMPQFIYLWVDDI